MSLLSLHWYFASRRFQEPWLNFRPVIFSDSCSMWFISPLAALKYHMKTMECIQSEGGSWCELAPSYIIVWKFPPVWKDIHFIENNKSKNNKMEWAYSSFNFWILSGSVSCICFLNCCLTIPTRSCVLCCCKLGTDNDISSYFSKDSQTYLKYCKHSDSSMQ